jgi:hypothetical protein
MPVRRRPNQPFSPNRRVCVHADGPMLVDPEFSGKLSGLINLCFLQRERKLEVTAFAALEGNPFGCLDANAVRDRQSVTEPSSLRRYAEGHDSDDSSDSEAGAAGGRGGGRGREAVAQADAEADADADAAAAAALAGGPRRPWARRWCFRRRAAPRARRASWRWPGCAAAAAACAAASGR